MVLLHLENARGGRADFPGLYRHATTGFEPLGIGFVWNVAATMALVWLYTFRGGVKSLIWTDSLKTFCLVVSVVLCICYIASDLQLGFGQMVRTIAVHDYSQVFFFDDINDKRYFFKQFLAGVFTVIAMSGLDQDMMQRNRAARISGIRRKTS